jgi:hypothetical protein
MAEGREPAAPGADAPELLVSIINYRTAAMTLEAVRSVLADRGGIDLLVAVVDNDSRDGSAEAIAEWIATEGAGAPVRLIRSPVNTGFSGGHNLGMAAARSEFCLVLNSDAMLRPGCLAALLAGARADPGAGLVAPRLEGADGTVQTSCFRALSPLSEVIRGAGSGPVTRALAAREVALGPDPDPGAIEWVSFAGVLIRRGVLDAVGPMDEGYFLYFEDVDYCLRARAAGWRIRRVPGARIVHLRGGSAPVKRLAAAKARLPAYYYAARTRYFRRAHGRLGPLLANLGWHAGRAIAQGRRLFAKPVPAAVEAEWRDIWTNFTDPLGDRRAPPPGG